MKSFSYITSKMNPQTVRVAVAIASLIMFILAAGAPGCPGGVGG